MDHHVKDVRGSNCNQSEEDMMDLRRGPWTVEEDFTLINYIAHHGEGRWNSLARCAGLKRTGKSCRLRWLNYLRPDVRRGNITLEEQLLILELHSRWGNRWSKIAQHLPGRTDNEIKNYWRTRVQKHAKQLKCDVNSKQFKDTMRYLWMPRLVERIQAAAAAGTSSTTASTPATRKATNLYSISNNMDMGMGSSSSSSSTQMVLPNNMAAAANNNNSFVGGAQLNLNPSSTNFAPENSTSSDSFGAQVSPVSDLTDCYNYPINQSNVSSADYYQVHYEDCLTSPTGYFNQGLEFQQAMEQSNNQWMDNGDISDNLWNIEDVWFLQQQFNNNV